ncbi:uncharacterized protein LOC143856381 isoform X2 [Tasmannia lanceolata]|uniref:uncharacterized protein LOC143856381 isoform X2 n=1 Tax=Tasmannia lanceolata TaxID=3420 RepID=UPI004062ACFC
MCILCVIQKWSRRVATMLPWLVIPLIGLWALSQLLPPSFRFEVTSPRLACVLVLLVTLFWYEILMPQLSSWRARRSARLREMRRLEVLEMQKLRKTATRRCRNCLTAYRDQNPVGGRFMCSYCGHISKRPVLDLPGSLGISNSGFIGDLVGKGGKIWNGKVWSDNGWMCSQDCFENGNWVSGTLVGKSSYWGKNGGGSYFSGDDRCLGEKSYSGVVVFACKLLPSLLLSVRWVWRKIFRVGSAREDGSLDGEQKGLLSKKGENGESKGEKARRKAEEKRQARLEKEMLEEEERKQREEVARLVEERRRLRDEKLEAEKDRSKGSAPHTETSTGRETERRRQEKRKDKDKGSSKSNSDVEELERKANRESGRKHEFDKKSDTERRDIQKTIIDSIRAQISETGHGLKGTMNNFSRPNGSSRYFDRVKGSFLSSSKAFNGATFFGRGAHTNATNATKVNKSAGSGDHVQTSTIRRELHSTEHITGKLTSNGDDKATSPLHLPVVSDPQPRPTVQKKSWQQLFTRSSDAPSSDANAIRRPNQNEQVDGRSQQTPDEASPTHHLDHQIHFGLSLPYAALPLSTGSLSSKSVSPPLVGEPGYDFISEGSELFEDPCYVPDPVALLGPVSESLDNFPLDLGSGFMKNKLPERPHVLKNVSASAEVNRPSPIESPMSRLRVAEERLMISGQLPYTPLSRDPHNSPLDEQGTWQMWGTPPLRQEGLSLVGGPASWILPLGQHKSDKEDIVHPLPHKGMIPEFVKENQALPRTHSPQKVCVRNGQNGGTYSPLGPGSNANHPWLQKSIFQPLPGDGKSHFPPLKPREDISRNDLIYSSPSKSAAGHPFELSPANNWSKDWTMHGQEEGDGNLNQARPPIGGLFSSPDVQSLWSFNQ